MKVRNHASLKLTSIRTMPGFEKSMFHRASKNKKRIYQNVCNFLALLLPRHASQERIFHAEFDHNKSRIWLIEKTFMIAQLITVPLAKIIWHRNVAKSSKFGGWQRISNPLKPMNNIFITISLSDLILHNSATSWFSFVVKTELRSNQRTVY